MVKPTIVISAFPACGKSYIVNHNTTEYMMLDSDSMKYSWIYENGVKTDRRNPDFIKDYIAHIKENIGKVDVIFVSSHSEVRKALRDNGILYFMVHPSLEMKETMLTRMRVRGNDDSFIKFQEEHFEQFINDIKKECKEITDNCEKSRCDLMKSTPFHEIELDEIRQPYIDKNMIYYLLDNSMGNLSSMWWNVA